MRVALLASPLGVGEGEMREKKGGVTSDPVLFCVQSKRKKGKKKIFFFFCFSKSASLSLLPRYCRFLELPGKGTNSFIAKQLGMFQNKIKKGRKRFSTPLCRTVGPFSEAI